MKNFADEIIEHIHRERERFIQARIRPPKALLIDPPDVQDIVTSDHFKYAPPIGPGGTVGAIGSMFGIDRVAFDERDLETMGTVSELPDGSRLRRTPPVLDVRGYGNSLRNARRIEMQERYPNTWRDHV